MVTRNQNLDERMNWFDRQFLRAQDFADESDYQVDRLRRHLRTLHTPGVAEGLTVSGQPGDTTVTVAPGTALDAQGCEIVLITQSPPLTLSPTSTTAELYVSYTEAQTNPSQDPGISGYTRITEVPQFTFRETAPGSQPVPVYGVLLAALSLSGGTLTSAPDVTVQTNAGAAVGDVTAFSVTLKRVGQPATAWPRLTASGPNQLSLAGDLRLTSQGTAQGGLSLAGSLTLGGGPQLSASSATQLTLAGDLSLASLGTALGALNVPGPLTLGAGLQFGNGKPITAISTDATLAAARDTAVPTEAAVKSYVDHRLGIQAGEVTFHNIAAGATWQRQTVSFGQAFASTPVVYIAANCVEVGGSGFDAQVQNVTTAQADIVIGSPNDTAAQVRIAWLAFGPLA